MSLSERRKNRQKWLDLPFASGPDRTPLPGDHLGHLVLDGFGDFNTRERQLVVGELEALVPGVAEQLHRDIVGELGKDIAALKTERDLWWKHLLMRKFEGECRDRLQRVESLRQAAEHLVDGLPALELPSIDIAPLAALVLALRAREADAKVHLAQQVDEVARTAPDVVAAERRAHARPQDRGRHGKIPSAVQQSIKIEDPHLAAIRRSFISGAVIEVAGGAVRRRVGEAVLVLKAARLRIILDERGRRDHALRKEVSQHLNNLTLRLVRGLFPIWGDHVTQHQVREVSKRAKRGASL